MPHREKSEIAIGAVGFGAVVTQTVFLRECLSLFNGNELTIGIVLANWMILTGIGAYCGKFIGRSGTPADGSVRPPEGRGIPDGERSGSILRILLLLSIIPIVTIFIVDISRNVFFASGTMIEVSSSFAVSFLMLLPYCTLSGYAFTLCARTLSLRKDENSIARTYSLEALGSVAGGILLNLVLLVYCSTAQALLIIAVVMLCTVVLLAVEPAYRMFRYSGIVLLTACAGVLLTTDLDRMMKSYLFPGQDILVHRDTPYGTITVTSREGQKNIFENGVLLWSVDDVPAAEEAVHYAMVQHSDPKAVLLISGGISGIPAELMKYEPDSIDYVELNPWLIDIGTPLIRPAGESRLRSISTDARRFVRTTGNRYDVVLINVADPSTAQINRYYTVEFFRELKERLTPGAVISLALHSSADYFNPEALALYSTVVRTLHDRFAHVLIVPGSKVFFLASDHPLSINISELIDRRGVPTEFVNRYYIDDVSNRERSNKITESLDSCAPLNTDFTPVAYYRQLNYWLSYSNVTLWIPVGIGLAILVFILRRLNAVGFGIFTTGFAASGIEVLLLFSFQILYGIMYQATGWIITVFMGGLAVGSWYTQRMIAEPTVILFRRILYLMAVYAAIVPAALVLLRDAQFGTVMIYCIFIVMTLVIGMFIGLEFSIGVRLLRGSVSHITSTMYAVDLLGSAVGAILVSVFLVPLVGMTTAFFVIAALCLASAILTWTGKNSYSGSSVPGDKNA